LRKSSTAFSMRVRPAVIASFDVPNVVISILWMAFDKST
jgi:hypothetical protein